MRITFAGVGEAFDEKLANTSILAESDSTSILLDCGFTAASAFWCAARNPLKLDALYISHFHGDHYFGIPALLVRSVEEQRTKPLTILGQPGVESRIKKLMELAYSNVMAKAKFDLYFLECTPGEEIHLGDFKLDFAMSDHSMPCLAIRLNNAEHSVFYSGDGRPTDATTRLAAGCDLIIHESFSLEKTVPGHGTVDSSVEFAKTAGAHTLAMVHVTRTVRHEQEREILARTKNIDGLKVLLPAQGDYLAL
ncbi:ribonuclease Z [uncultured Pseudodesulfovibrio sp.]|uniref:MBL fold metallo-hydrolase n=1 Tax=uncultured Pseudodesulfovibrio sp. TaxID=2035858 RepID=UPI0029C6E8B8|nr:ribonuclease Z [uncultured Pseudodesulfovibrio sp.]